MVRTALFRAQRERLQMTQRELAEQLDLSPQQISNYERGRAPIPKLTELAISALLGKQAANTGLPLNQEEQTVLQQFVQKLRDTLGKQLVLTILFGSKARGDFGAESDLDVLIVVQKKTMTVRETVFTLLFALDPFYQQRISPVIFSLKEFQENEKLHSPLIQTIKREGKML